MCRSLQAWAFLWQLHIAKQVSGFRSTCVEPAAFYAHCAESTCQSHQPSPQRGHETASIVMCRNYLCYLAAKNGRIATPENFEQWDLGLQAAKTMLRCLHVTVVKLWGMRHNHLILSHHVDDDFIALLEASGQLQMAQTATYMKSLTESLGMHCLATPVAAPHGVTLVLQLSPTPGLHEPVCVAVPSSSL